MSELNNIDQDGGNRGAPAQNEDELSSISPLQITEIVEVLMNHSSVESLKTARLVSKLWRGEATPRLFHKGYFTIPFDFYDRPLSENFSDVSQMRKFLSPHLNSNPNKFRISNVQILHYPDLEFFDKVSTRILGHLVENLVFGVHDRPDILEQLLKYTRLTNLRVLNPRPKFLERGELPLPFCRELLRICARVIKPPRTLTLADLNMFVNCGEDPFCMENFNRFTHLPNIWIQKLSFGFAAFPDDPCFPDIRERMSGMLSRLLERNKDVLTSLRVWGSEMYWEETVVPVLPKLEFFYLSLYPPRRRHDIFVPPKYRSPPNFHWAINMPNLKDMDVFYSYNKLTSSQPEEDKNEPNLLVGYFYGQKPAESLKRLTYCDFGCDFNMVPLLKCFSSLEFLSYPHFADFSKGARSIFTWGKELKTLRLGLFFEVMTSKISSFDSILTGFPQKTVDKIKNAPAGWTLKEIMGGSGDFTIDSLRTQPSLLDLTKLERIIFKLRGNPLKYLPKKIFTVAGEYAFKLRPALKVEFYLGRCESPQCAKDALKEVLKLPNVKIIENMY